MSDGSRAVALLNRGTNGSVDCIVNWTDIGFEANTRATVRDCWLRKDVLTTNGMYSASVDAMTATILRITPVSAEYSTTLSISAPNGAQPQIELRGQHLDWCSIEFSSDFYNWTKLAMLTNWSGKIIFSEPLKTTEAWRFYRSVKP
jgi:hypothetical protein